MEIDRRKVRVTIELDVSEGPRMRRHRRNSGDFRQLVGNPLLDYAEQLLAKEFGLRASDGHATVVYGTDHVVTRAMREGTPMLTGVDKSDPLALVNQGWRQVADDTFLRIDG